jgi:hypothetical protein
MASGRKKQQNLDKPRAFKVQRMPKMRNRLLVAKGK